MNGMPVAQVEGVRRRWSSSTKQSRTATRNEKLARFPLRPQRKRNRSELSSPRPTPSRWLAAAVPRARCPIDHHHLRLALGATGTRCDATFRSWRDSVPHWKHEQARPIARPASCPGSQPAGGLATSEQVPLPRR
jgi:hypothetical protein